MKKNLCKDCGKELGLEVAEYGLCDECFMIQEHEKYLADQAGIPVSEVGSLFEMYADKNKILGDDQMLCAKCGSNNVDCNVSLLDEVLLYLNCLDCGYEYKDTSGLYDQYQAEMESEYDNEDCVVPYPEDESTFSFRESMALCYIKGNKNKSSISIKEFLRCVEKYYNEFDPEDDYSTYVMDEFCHHNDFKFEKYTELVEIFLSPLVEDDDEDEYEEQYDDGPYGGAFSSWDDFYNWKER